MKIREENANIMEILDNERKNTILQREDTEKSDRKVKELEEKVEIDSKIGNGRETEAKNLQ